ncbi:hypothetical protein STEG23_002755, partial [Scotinomys teguina]
MKLEVRYLMAAKSPTNAESTNSLAGVTFPELFWAIYTPEVLFYNIVVRQKSHEAVEAFVHCQTIFLFFKGIFHFVFKGLYHLLKVIFSDEFCFFCI